MNENRKESNDQQRPSSWDILAGKVFIGLTRSKAAQDATLYKGGGNGRSAKEYLVRGGLAVPRTRHKHLLLALKRQ